MRSNFWLALYIDAIIVICTCAYLFYSRHKSRLLYPTPKPCCCKRIHSDAKLKDPFSLAQKDLNHLYDDIKKVSRLTWSHHVAWSQWRGLLTLSHLASMPSSDYCDWFLKLRNPNKGVISVLHRSFLCPNPSWSPYVTTTLTGRARPSDQW